MRFPIEQFLTPEPTAAVPEGYTLVDDALLRGLPHRIALEGQIELVLLVPNGQATLWRDTPPDQALSRAGDERIPHDDKADPFAPRLDRVPARLLLRQRRRVRAVLPLAANLRQLVDIQGDGREQLLEVVILGWDLRAGNLRGPGDFGGRLKLAWRRRERAVERYSTPPINPYLLPRLQPEFRMISLLGLRQLRPTMRFTAKQVQLKFMSKVKP
ncbi:MAG: hypothetical protein JJT90_12240 [Ectothiorhodospiraceae bacterium]|nr:hypothetical protein [Ectothiorhodospiraceae bacterium]